MHPLVSAAELGTIDATVFDCRSTLTDKLQGRRDYEAGHIPGARFADLDTDLAGEPGRRGRHPLPDREALAGFLRDAGVNSDAVVVCYDQNHGAFAARLWWLLRWLGHERVAVLDGGLDAWIAAGEPLETSIPSTTPGDFAAREPLTRTCEAGELLSGEYRLLDARDAARYRGEIEPIDAVAGHIPGAQCFPFTANLDQGQFRTPAELKARFGNAGDNVACYCGSGVTATHNILAMMLAGLPEPALYPGSWSEWIEDPARPVATGDE